VKKILAIVLAVILTLTLLLPGVAFATGNHNCLDMTHYNGSVPGKTYWCGPCSGTSIGRYYRDVVDRDECGPVIEGFEWGNDGDSLDTNGGNVDWTVTVWGPAYAEIDTSQHHSGTRSAEFYRLWDEEDGYVEASYSDYHPTWRGFWLMTDGNVRPTTITGDGQHAILVKVNGNTLQYSDGAWHDTGFYLSPYTWYLIEFKNINWGTATYSIYVGGNCVQDGVPMWSYTGYNGITAYYSCEYTGSFWIDDIFNPVVSEDFEWGNDGDSLDTDGGDVDWTVTVAGPAYAEIDTSQHHLGTRSAEFYRLWDEEDGYVEASYSDYRPTWRGFWLMTDGNVRPTTITGDGQHAIEVKVNGQALQYYYGGWQSTSFSLVPYTWHLIEFKNINWGTATYSIYGDGNCVQDGVPMCSDIVYNGITAYSSCENTGSFWIDDIDVPIVDYPALPADDAMYDRLYDYMDTGTLGPTYPVDYGLGFVEMALHYGYDNFSYVYDDNVTHADYDAIVKNAIDHGWPIALAAMGLLSGFSGVEALYTDETHGDNHWPCTVGHWIAIKGYHDGYMGHAHVVICTDSWSGADNLYLDWDQLVDVVGDNLKAVIIKDVDPDGDGPCVEDFEWGDDGTSLSAWGGEVDWDVSTSGASKAEIDVIPARPGGTGTRSARIYRASGKTVYAYYKLLQPSYIGFWVRKDGKAYASIYNGDGSRYISVHINSAEQLQWWDGAYHTVYTVSPNTWYKIEFKDINWTAGTYDIYIYNANGNLLAYKTGANMKSGVGYPGNLYFGSWSQSGTFWIDDINDSLRPLGG
jgi:hypothetical protein